MSEPLPAAVQAETLLVMAHPMYGAIRSPEHVRRFMEHHVWAVWDFMVLLTSLRDRLARPGRWWGPSAASRAAQRFVNEIIVGEETDVFDGEYRSHFELYLAAMDEAGANTYPMRYFQRLVAQGTHPLVAVMRVQPPGGAARFLANTIETVECDSVPCVAASFTWGREHVIPGMFDALLTDLPDGYPLLRRYLERHVEVDSGEHGPLASRLMEAVCRTDGEWQDAIGAGLRALRARSRLWDAVWRSVVQQTATVPATPSDKETL